MDKKYEIKEISTPRNVKRIVVDTETGIQYILERHGNTGGITLYTDDNGDPLYDDRYLNKQI